MREEEVAMINTTHTTHTTIQNEAHKDYYVADIADQFDSEHEATTTPPTTTLNENEILQKMIHDKNFFAEEKLKTSNQGGGISHLSITKQVSGFGVTKMTMTSKTPKGQNSKIFPTSTNNSLGGSDNRSMLFSNNNKRKSITAIGLQSTKKKNIKTVIRGVERGVFVITSIAENVCEVVLVQQQKIGGGMTLAKSLLSDKIDQGLAIIDEVKDYFERGGREVDRELRKEFIRSIPLVVPSAEQRKFVERTIHETKKKLRGQNLGMKPWHQVSERSERALMKTSMRATTKLN